MSLVAERRRALVDAGFRTFGDAALWGDQPVTVRVKTQDEDDRFGKVAIVNRGTILRVRSWEVEQPTVGTTVAVGGVQYRLKAGLMLDAKGVWDCPVTQVQP